MCWLRNRAVSRGWRAVGVIVTVIALTIGLGGLVAPSAIAYGPGYPSMQVTLTEGPGQVMGFGWTEDANVTVTRTRASVPTDLATVSTGTPWPGWFQYPVGNGVLMTGDTVTVTGTTSGYSRDLQVIALGVTHFDVPDSTLSGTKGSSAGGWGDLTTSLGNMFPGGGTQVTVPASTATTWSAVLPAEDFELMEGVGASAWQSDADGDTLQVGRQVPNPTIHLDENAVSMQGWMPNSTQNVSIDDDPGDGTPYPYTYQVTT